MKIHLVGNGHEYFNVASSSPSIYDGRACDFGEAVAN
jgi:hypothetical protein